MLHVPYVARTALVLPMQAYAAEGVTAEMRRAGVERSEAVYRMLMFCLGRAGHAQRAVDFLHGLQPSTAAQGASAATTDCGLPVL